MIYIPFFIVILIDKRDGKRDEYRDEYRTVHTTAQHAHACTCTPPRERDGKKVYTHRLPPHSTPHSSTGRCTSGTERTEKRYEPEAHQHQRHTTPPTTAAPPQHTGTGTRLERETETKRKKRYDPPPATRLHRCTPLHTHHSTYTTA